MKTKITPNFFDIDAITSVLEIARTARYAVEVDRLVKIAITSSAVEELGRGYYKRMLASSYFGGANEPSRRDLDSLASDWVAVGDDMCAAMKSLTHEPEMANVCETRWKALSKSRTKCADGFEKPGYQ
ncbi:hypothetical protein [Pseudomonas mucidolens]|uniref:hypothetical protein n=1 Tax=Pseudomonas mucidolens TaxID=46679 RepID=UPI0030D9ADCF